MLSTYMNMFLFTYFQFLAFLEPVSVANTFSQSKYRM